MQKRFKQLLNARIDFIYLYKDNKEDNYRFFFNFNYSLKETVYAQDFF